MKTEKNLLNIIIALAIVMGFTFFATFIVYYVRENYGLSCDCSNSLPILMILLSSLGVFVGILTYYFVDKRNVKEKEIIEKNINETLNFLDVDERNVIKYIIQNNGFISQAKLTFNLKYDKVKISRVLKKLESKNIIYKKDKGMTKEVYLSNKLKDLFL
jgi:uncharacterized membrane protein